MNIAYFSNQFADREGHGLARYARELYLAMRELDTPDKIFPVSAWSSMESHRLESLIEATGHQILPWGQKATPLAWTFIGNPKIENWLKQEVDLVHSVALGYPIATRKPYVVTIHDLGPLTHPEHFTRKGTWIMRRSLRQAVKKADALICVSEATAEEVLEVVGPQVADRLTVVHEGIGAKFFEPAPDSRLEIVRQLEAANTPFILSTGKISPRKNTLGIIRALASIADVIPHHLVHVGGEGWNTEAVREEFQNSPIAGRIHFSGFVSDEELRALYARASAYVHPSLFEGFGLPLLEAMASDCPVVTSNISSLPEVAGDAAMLVDPGSVEEIAAGIERVCTDAGFAANLVERGKARARQFTWEACAEGVLNVYRSVI